MFNKAKGGSGRAEPSYTIERKHMWAGTYQPGGRQEQDITAIKKTRVGRWVPIEAKGDSNRAEFSFKEGGMNRRVGINTEGLYNSK